MQPVQATNKSKTLSVEEEMELAIRSSTFTPAVRISTTTSQEMTKVIRQEMTLFGNGGTRGRYLQLVYEYLMSVPPTRLNGLKRLKRLNGRFLLLALSALGCEPVSVTQPWTLYVSCGHIFKDMQQSSSSMISMNHHE